MACRLEADCDLPEPGPKLERFEEALAPWPAVSAAGHDLM